MLAFFFGLIVSISTWSAPQPVYSEGLIVIYGGQPLIAANAAWHGYDLAPYGGCGFSAISPAMLGRIAWFRSEHGPWFGPCLSVDAVARVHAYASIYDRHEVAEVSWALAAQLGFSNGGQWGYAFFGACPPNADSLAVDPQPYAPLLTFDLGPPDHTPSFYPYPAQQLPVVCP